MLVPFLSIFDTIIYDWGSMSYRIKVLLIFFCLKAFSDFKAFIRCVRKLVF